MKAFKLYITIALIIILGAAFYAVKNRIESIQLKKIIERLSADSRIAEVVVTNVRHDAEAKKTYTTIKFLEYDTQLNPLAPRYFTFSGNIIQFQSMVVRFDDFYVKRGHPLKGKSAYLFLKAFRLTDDAAEIFEITKINEVPSGYEVKKAKSSFEKRIWQKFWEYALDPAKADRVGIKSAQIEAPGTKFIPGMIYTIKIEHHGGLRIDAQPVPFIFKNEKIKF